MAYDLFAVVEKAYLYDKVCVSFEMTYNGNGLMQGGKMFGRKKKIVAREYDKENWKPALKCSICNGEQVAGFQNIHTGEFKEEVLIRNEQELVVFMKKYGIVEMNKIY